MGKKFDETNAVTVEILESCFIYFLIKDGEVVYVGQTSVGISRPLSHKDKVFNEIKLIYCERGDLDRLEDKYIKKYDPIYNKQPNMVMNISLTKAKLDVLKNTGTKVGMRRIREAVRELDIKLWSYHGNSYMSVNDYEQLEHHVAGGKR